MLITIRRQFVNLELIQTTGIATLAWKGTCVLIQKWALLFLANQDTIKTKKVQFGAKNVQLVKAAIHYQLVPVQAGATLISETWNVISALIDISARRKMLLLLFHVLLALLPKEKEILNAQLALLEAIVYMAKSMIAYPTNTIQKKNNQDVHYALLVVPAKTAFY